MPNRTRLTRTALAGLAAALMAATGASAMQDGRGEAAAGHPADLRSFPQDEAWLDQTAPLPPRAVPIHGGDGGGGVDLQLVLLAVAGTVALAGGMTLAANRGDTPTAC